MLTATITLSFMMRNTSPIGWIPLLAIKVLFEGSLWPFLFAGVLVAIPVIGLTIAIDTQYFLGTIDGENWVLTSYNFLRRNILEGLSEYFGSDAKHKYVLGFAPEIFTVMYPVVLAACCYTHIRRKHNKGQSPYLTYYCIFYVLVFSFIPHKELRFLMPIIPFAMLMAGELLSTTLASNGWLATLLSVMLKLHIVIEVVTFGIFNRYTQRDWDYDAYLTSKETPIHSLYTQESYTSPHYSWFHGSGTKLYLAQQDPQFARLAFGHPLP